MPVGIFDSGLGGLTVLSEVKRQLPNQSFIYLGDNANAPYGIRPADEIYKLTCASVDLLFAQGCDLVVLACNTASAVALRRLQEAGLPDGKRVLGVFVPLIEAMTERNWGDVSPPREVDIKNVALFATPATVASRAFQRELAFRAIGVDVETQPCGGLVDALEDNDLDLAEALARAYVAALKKRMPEPQAAVLGCTHYPILKPVFEEALGPNVTVFSQGEIVASSLADYLRRHKGFQDPSGELRYLTTGDAIEVSSSATRFLKNSVKFEKAS